MIKTLSVVIPRKTVICGGTLFLSFFFKHNFFLRTIELFVKIVYHARNSFHFTTPFYLKKTRKKSQKLKMKKQKIAIKNRLNQQQLFPRQLSGITLTSSKKTRSMKFTVLTKTSLCRMDRIPNFIQFCITTKSTTILFITQKVPRIP